MLFRVSPVLAGLAAVAHALPNFGYSSPRDGEVEKRASPDNIVYVTSATDYCIIVPRNAHTTIGDSEATGQTKTYCSIPYDGSQGQLPSNFWSNVAFTHPAGTNGARTVQLTGCIRPSTLDRLVPGDGGGQYDSAPGGSGQGNPVGSICLGYNHYVELIEPDANRACIRCCDNQNDCPLWHDTEGCTVAIPGNYFDCW